MRPYTENRANMSLSVISRGNFPRYSESFSSEIEVEGGLF